MSTEKINTLHPEIPVSPEWPENHLNLLNMPLHPFLVKTRLYKVILKFLYLFHKVYRYMTFLDWVRSQNGKGLINDYYNKQADYHNRYMLHEAIIENYKLRENPVNYLEFGVARGDMIRFWASRNDHPESTFTGFDSFEGLPENWEGKEAGHFDQKGNIPQIEDSRVSFVKGWFQDTVHNDLSKRNFELQNVFHFDADLFSSTLFVLFQLHNFLSDHDILIFDEFSSYEHEFLAFQLFKECTGREWEYELIGAVNNYRQIAIILK